MITGRDTAERVKRRHQKFIAESRLNLIDKLRAQAERLYVSPSIIIEKDIDNTLNEIEEVSLPLLESEVLENIEENHTAPITDIESEASTKQQVGLPLPTLQQYQLRLIPSDVQINDNVPVEQNEDFWSLIYNVYMDLKFIHDNPTQLSSVNSFESRFDTLVRMNKLSYPDSYCDEQNILWSWGLVVSFYENSDPSYLSRSLRMLRTIGKSANSPVAQNFS